MMRILLFLLSMLFSSLASAFVFPTPVLQPHFPQAYPSAQSAPPPAGAGSGSGAGIDKTDIGHVAGVICILSPCTSSVAMAPVGIIPPAGWPSDPATGKPTPPPSTPMPNAWYCANSDINSCAATPEAATQSAIAKMINFTLSDGPTCTGPDSSQGWWCTFDGNRGYGLEGFRAYVTFSPAYAQCPSGYAQSGSSCKLDSTGSSGAVQKPANTPCQVLLDNGSFHWDTSNPACSSRGAGPYWTDDDGNKETIDTGSGTFSVVSKDGSSGTDMGPANANTLPVKTWQNVTDSAGVPHRLETTTTLDSNGNVTGHSYKIDGNPVTLDVFNNTLSGQPYNPSNPSNSNNTNPASSPSTSGGSGSSQSITCETVGTCGVAQDSTLKDVAAKTGSIQTSLSDFFKNFTTAVAVPQLYTPSTTTAQSALQDFSNQIKATPIVTSVTGFFDVNFQGGACPTWTIPVVNVMGLSIGGIEIDQFCTPTAYRVYSIIAVVTLVVCGFFAFRVAVDN